MQNKVYTERRLFTEEQIATIHSNETQDGVILTISEASYKSDSRMLYLSYDEAIVLAKQITDFVNENR
jgi:tRNA G18 (ribose-2'-O)-methylase SpoU